MKNTTKRFTTLAATALIAVSTLGAADACRPPRRGKFPAGRWRRDPLRASGADGRERSARDQQYAVSSGSAAQSWDSTSGFWRWPGSKDPYSDSDG